MRLSQTVFWAVGAWLCLAPQMSAVGHAATGHHLQLHELVRQSDATVLAHTVGQHAFWDHGRIVTRVDVGIDEVWHGRLQSGNTVAVYTLGGTVGDIGQRVDGAATLPSYGRVVLHLRRAAHGYVPTAMAQGVWNVDGLYGQTATVVPQVKHHGTGLQMLLDGSHKDLARTPGSLAALRAAVVEAARARP